RSGSAAALPRLCAGPAPAGSALAACARRRGDDTDRPRIVDAQDEAFSEVELVMDAVLRREPGTQILADDEHADTRIDEDAALDRRLEDAARAQPPQMLELQRGAARVKAKERSVERGGQSGRIGPGIARLVEHCDRGEHVLERTVDRRPVAAGVALPALAGEQAGQAELALTAIDELVLAVGDR